MRQIKLRAPRIMEHQYTHVHFRARQTPNPRILNKAMAIPTLKSIMDATTSGIGKLTVAAFCGLKAKETIEIRQSSRRPIAETKTEGNETPSTPKMKR